MILICLNQDLAQNLSFKIIMFFLDQNLAQNLRLKMIMFFLELQARQILCEEILLNLKFTLFQLNFQLLNTNLILII